MSIRKAGGIQKASAFNLGVLCLIELGAWRFGKILHSMRLSWDNSNEQKIKHIWNKYFRPV
jgi:hypothetical protein